VRHVLRITGAGTCDESCVPPGIMYSNLEMWFLAPIDSYTMIEEVKRSWLNIISCGGGGCTKSNGTQCCTREVFQFVTDGSRFGSFVFFVSNKAFMKSLLKVVSGGMKQNVLAAIALAAATSPAYNSLIANNKRGGKVWTKEDVSALPEVLQFKSNSRALLTLEFINSAVDETKKQQQVVIEGGDDVYFALEVIQAVVSATLPPMQRDSWLSSVTSCCTTPSNSILTLTNAGIYLEHCAGKDIRMLTCIPWPMIDGAYWSNFQAINPMGPLCCQGKNHETPVYGFPGSQLHLHVDGNAHFGIGIQLPNRYFSGLPVGDEEAGRSAVPIEKDYSADVDLNQLVDVLQHNLHLPWLQRHGDLAADPRLTALLEGDDTIDAKSVLASVDAGDESQVQEVKVGESKLDEVQYMKR